MARRLLVAALARAEDRSAEVDKIFSDITPTSPGCACAVLQDGKVTARKAGDAIVEVRDPDTGIAGTVEVTVAP